MDVNEWKRQNFAELSAKAEGAVGLYLERPSGLLVRVRSIVADDWGVRITLERVDLAGNGAVRGGVPPRDIAGAWEIFSPSELEWAFRYVPMRIEFYPEVVEAMKQLAADAAERGEATTYEAALKISGTCRQARHQEEQRRRAEQKPVVKTVAPDGNIVRRGGIWWSLKD
jgi:hypothetical protein